MIYDPSKGKLSIGTHNNPGHDSTGFELRPGERLSLHIYVDGGLVEVVANNRASLVCHEQLVGSVGSTGSIGFVGSTGSVGSVGSVSNVLNPK